MRLGGGAADVVRETSNSLLIALTCDTDADLFDPSIAEGQGERPPRWRGLDEGLPTIIDSATEICDRFGLRPKFTWFVRVDNQLEYYHGDACYLLNCYNKIWRSRSTLGDEVAWHPHIYKFENGHWLHQNDEDAFEAALSRAHAQFTRFAGPPRSSRIGEAAFSNRIAKTLDDLGVDCDSTAMPGRERRDADRVLDWRGTPASPYFPSSQDYRRPGIPSRKFLEVPMSMVKVMASYDHHPLLRYVDLSFHPRAMKEGLQESLSAMRVLVTMTHPSGVLPGIRRGGHGLISFDIDAYRSNLEFILWHCAQSHRAVEFVTISACRSLFTEHAQNFQ